jgi:hypothetical protein
MVILSRPTAAIRLALTTSSSEDALASGQAVDIAYQVVAIRETPPGDESEEQALQGIALGPQGHLYVSDAASGRVYELKLQGEFHAP